MSRVVPFQIPGLGSEVGGPLLALHTTVMSVQAPLHGYTSVQGWMGAGAGHQATCVKQTG